MAYYSLKNILSKNCEWNLINGKRTNGKSYAVGEYCIKDFFENGHKLFYLRRSEKEIKVEDVKEWFSHFDLLELSGGIYNTISIYRGRIYLAFSDGEKVEKGEILGRYGALCYSKKYKSTLQDPNYYNMIFEEYITTDPYLPNEPNELIDFSISLFRNRKGKVFMIGNTISEVCPYFTDWNLINLYNQKVGEIKVYTKDNENGGTLRIACEITDKETEGGQMAFGQVAKQVAGLDIAGKEYPLTNRIGKHFKQVYSIYLKYDVIEFRIDWLVNSINGEMCLGVYNSYRDIRETDRCVTDVITTNPLWSNCLKDNKIEKRYAQLIKEKRVFFKTHAIGQTFEQINAICHFF